MKRIYAFDMGKASIGYCVREDNDIKDLGSLIIEKDHSEVSSNRDRRRTYRTLKAHKVRENWLNKLWLSANLEILSPDDERFKREFASKDDKTLYNSTILRIALLQGKKLETWQIYKALHSAIQRRGYDSDIAWANSTDDKENEEAIKKYSCIDDVELINSEEFKYPCYYDALLLGLWNETTPFEFNRTIGENPIKVRTSGRVAPRSLVEKELTELWLQAQKQLPNLQNIPTEEFLYGEYKQAYGSYYVKEFKRYRGTERDWQGVLGQKIPRFDNRIIAKCKLLPKRNVCKANTIENIKFTLLMKLKNLRYFNAETKEQAMLSPHEIKQIYELKCPVWEETYEKYKSGEVKNPSFTINKTDIEKIIGKKKIQDKFETFKANISGRSSFCRRAMQIMIDIIVNCIMPNEINVEKYADADDVKNGISKDEIKDMLSKIGDWNNLYIPDNRYELETLSSEADKQSDLLIGNITNPIVRNRLQIFKSLLNGLIAENGLPDEVIFEFVRDGADNSLFGSIKAQNTEKYMKSQEKENEDIKKDLDRVNAYNEINFLKYKLAKAQDFLCIYSGKKIGISDFDNCEIDHIYPRSQGGNDALYNKVLCYKEENQDKKGRTPYEWLVFDKERWTQFTARVNGLKAKLGKKKASLLTLPPQECTKLIESYNGLAETAQVAKVASSITHFICGWGMQTKGEKRHVYVENGSTTCKIRNIYKLNSILGNDVKKNRSNPKHHALDAICISYAMDLKYNKDSHKYNIEGFNRPYVEQKISELMPYPYTNKKPLKSNTTPLETIYGKRVIDGKVCITNRVDLMGIGQNANSINKIIDEKIKNDLLNKLEENLSVQDWNNLLANYIHPTKKTKVKKVITIVSEGTSEFDDNGRERIGEFVDFGNKGTKNQFKHSKAHKGQILYYDKKGTTKVMPIYANKSTKETREQLQNTGCKLYNRGEMFYSGCLIEIPNDFKAGANTCPKGIYKLRTIKSKGNILIESNTGNEISTSAKNLCEAKFYKTNK